VDTAGIRDTDDVVEKIGVTRAMSAAEDADLIIYVVDGSRALDENDYQIMEFIKDRKAVVLLNKSDLEQVVSIDEIMEKSGHAVIAISAKKESGIDKLEEEIKSLFYEGEIDFNDQVMITNVRHAQALREAYDSILMVKRSIEDEMPEDFYSIDLMNAYEKLGLIIGESVEDDLVNEIFSKFCMGK
jgi:tRNA modification GTPase